MLTRIVRRVISHHGSDCSLNSHTLRGSRCVVVERVDYPQIRKSVARVVGDHQEGWKEKKVRVDYYTDLVYGGGFWESVCIPGRGRELP